MTKPYYTENTESVEFKLAKRQNTYSKIQKYEEMVRQINPKVDYFLNSYKAKIFKNAMKMK